jgi:hypothetical protein
MKNPQIDGKKKKELNSFVRYYCRVVEALARHGGSPNSNKRSRDSPDDVQPVNLPTPIKKPRPDTRQSATERLFKIVMDLDADIKRVERKADVNEEEIKKVEIKADNNTQAIKKVEIKTDNNTQAIKKVEIKADNNTQAIQNATTIISGMNTSLANLVQLFNTNPVLNPNLPPV